MTVLNWLIVIVLWGLWVHDLRAYTKRFAPVMLVFTLSWGMHYAVGGVITMLSESSFLPFYAEDRKECLLLCSLLMGFFFVVSFKAFYHRLGSRDFGAMPQHYPWHFYQPLLVFSILATLCAVLFVWKIGPSRYFSPDLAQYRAHLNDYAEPGIGVYYNLATLMIPCLFLLVSFTYYHRRRLILFATCMYALVFVCLFAPLGGRGRVMNVVVILLVMWYLERRGLTRQMVVRGASVVVVLLAIAQVWGNVRGKEASVDLAEAAQHDVLPSLRTATTRLEFQAYILGTYPAGGFLYGGSYPQAVLGPFYKYVPSALTSTDLVRDASSRWFMDAVGKDREAAISPSFLGELYINFGILGILVSGCIFALLIRLLQAGIGPYSLERAYFLYYGLYLVMHGGLYHVFDSLWLFAPIWVCHRLCIHSRVAYYCQSTRELAMWRKPLSSVRSIRRSNRPLPRISQPLSFESPSPSIYGARSGGEYQ